MLLKFALLLLFGLTLSASSSDDRDEFIASLIRNNKRYPVDESLEATVREYLDVSCGGDLLEITLIFNTYHWYFLTDETSAMLRDGKLCIGEDEKCCATNLPGKVKYLKLSQHECDLSRVDTSFGINYTTTMMFTHASNETCNFSISCLKPYEEKYTGKMLQLYDEKPVPLAEGAPSAAFPTGAQLAISGTLADKNTPDYLASYPKVCHAVPQNSSHDSIPILVNGCPVDLTHQVLASLYQDTMYLNYGTTAWIYFNLIPAMIPTEHIRVNRSYAPFFVRCEFVACSTSRLHGIYGMKTCPAINQCKEPAVHKRAIPATFFEDSRVRFTAETVLFKVYDYMERKIQPLFNPLHEEKIMGYRPIRPGWEELPSPDDVPAGCPLFHKRKSNLRLCILSDNEREAMYIIVCALCFVLGMVVSAVIFCCQSRREDAAERKNEERRKERVYSRAAEAVPLTDKKARAEAVARSMEGKGLILAEGAIERMEAEKRDRVVREAVRDCFQEYRSGEWLSPVSESDVDGDINTDV